jgi:hypothetical protein
MQFAGDAYAEGISNHAAGSEIEVLVDTIDATVEALDKAAEWWGNLISGLPKHAEEERGYQDEMEVITELQGRWRELRVELVNHPENAELSFADDDKED